MSTHQLNGTELWYEERGGGTPILFLHGMMAGSRFFINQLNSLEGNYRPIVLDFRGHGRSATPEAGHLLPQYARDLEAFLEVQSLDEIIIVGHSMGASVAWDFVKQFGTDQLGGLVVVDQPAAEFAWEDNEHADTDLDGLKQFMEMAQTDHESLNELASEAIFKEPSSLSEEIRRLVYDEFSRCPPPVKSAIIFDQIMRDYRSVLKELDLDTLVCAGADESYMPIAPIENVADLIPNAEFTLFEESGHCPMIEEPDQFDRELTEFIESL